jgi:Lrp/AsnC family transcriptional regulator for asnA, asnC and gidA
MVTAFVAVKVGTGELLSWVKTVRESIAKVEGVKEVYSTLGRFDLIAKVEAKSVEELANIVVDGIRSIEGVIGTETFLVAAP